MEATKPLISVIVPVYNVEPYLHRCIDSILAQTYENLEIILVDDGSPDRCGEICDEYAAKDKRVIVCHKQNEGVSVARNFGTAHVSGEYIAYIDSDDYIAEDYVEYLFELLEKNEADISLCPIIETNHDNADFMATYGIERIIPGEKCLRWSWQEKTRIKYPNIPYGTVRKALEKRNSGKIYISQRS